jgi:phosphate-selective porin
LNDNWNIGLIWVISGEYRVFSGYIINKADKLLIAFLKEEAEQFS